MWTGRTWPRDHRWYDPNSHLIGPEYTLRALGTIYVVSARVLGGFVHPRLRNMRLSGSTEGGSGAWGDGGEGLRVAGGRRWCLVVGDRWLGGKRKVKGL